MRICILGTGYVGLVSGVCLAAKGHSVTCVELRVDVVEKLNRGQPHIHERGLPELLQRVVFENRFRATLALNEALADCPLVVIAVGTSSANGTIDVPQIKAAATQVGGWLKSATGFLAVVVKSTVLPGTTDTLVRTILEETSGKQLGDWGLGMNPEFLREGNAVEDFLQPDRLVLGHEDSQTLALLQEVYSSWSCEKLVVNTRTAEMIKCANNSLLATQISAVNELANLCFEIGGIDAHQVLAGVQLDQRWNPLIAGRRINPGILAYLNPGCGFGGSCLPKDVHALRALGQEHGLEMPLLQAVLEINDRQPQQVLRLLRSHFGVLAGRRILVLGLAFKPETDDVRESVSLKIIRHLVELRCTIQAHDPIAAPNACAELRDSPVTMINDWTEALTAVDAVIVATKCPDYARLREPSLASRLHGKVIVDPRRMFRPQDFPHATYLTVGWRPMT